MRGPAAAILLALAVLALPAGARAAGPQPVNVRAGLHDGFARLVFDWPAPVGFSAALAGRTLRVRFDRKLKPSFAGVRRALGERIGALALDADGRTVTAALRRDYTVRGFTAGTRVVVDLTPKEAKAPDPPDTRSAAPQAGPAAQPDPGAPVRLGPGARAEPAPGPALPVRTARDPHYGRLVFGWPRKVPFTVNRTGRSVVVRFAAPASVDIDALRNGLPPQIDEANARTTPDGLEVELSVIEDAQLRYFHNGTSVVLDVVAPGAPKPAPPRSAARSGTETRPRAAGQAEAPSERPPPLLVSVDARRIGEESEIRFNWRKPVPAAVFTRGAGLWAVFGRRARFDLAPLGIMGGAAFARVRQHTGERSTDVRLPLPAGFSVAVRREGTVWVLTLGPGTTALARPVGMSVARDGEDGTALHILTGHDNRVITLRDPGIGDSLVAVATSMPGAGVAPARRFAEFTLLQSAQGVAVRPLEDSLRVRSEADRVVVSRPGGLHISPVDDATLARPAAARGRPLVDLARWRRGPLEAFHRIEQALLAKTRRPKGAQRNAARLGLARFYAGHDMGGEALGVIAALLRDDRGMIEDPAIRALRGVARYLAHHYAEAAADLGHPSLAGVRELYPWRAGIAAARGDWVEAHRLFRDTDPTVAGLPPRFAIPFGLLAAEAALSVDDLDAAETRLAALAGRPANESQLDRMTYLQGHLLRQRDKVSRAIELWRSLVESGGREGRATAALAIVNAERDLGTIAPAEAIERLEKLRFAWRDGVFEFDLLHTLGRLYAEVGDLRNALVTLRRAATYFKDIEGAQALTADMRKLFRKFYLEGGADKLQPVVALGLFREFRELTPGGEAGDRMIRNLVERLAAVDLLDEAAELLEDQVRFRLAGEAKAEAGTRLAEILLADRRPAKAGKALDVSVIDDMPGALARKRRLLRGRTLLAKNRPAEALEVIENDHGEASDLLRAQVYWQTGKWDAARLVLARLTGGFDPASLDEDAAQLLLRRAIALRLAHNQTGIDFLRERFGAGMEKTKLGAAFKAVVGRPESGIVDYDALARDAAELDTFVSFLDSLKNEQAAKPPAETAGAS